MRPEIREKLAQSSFYKIKPDIVIGSTVVSSSIQRGILGFLFAVPPYKARIIMLWSHK